MEICDHLNLQPYNTFGINAVAEKFIKVDNEEEVKEVLSNRDFAKKLNLILGGGSNILLTKDVPGLTLHLGIKGIDLIDETDNHYIIRVGGGENWHQFVMHCVNAQWAGLENLSLIPGNVGASPMQNIGAYGVEVKDCIVEVHAIEKSTGNKVVFSAEECDFGYRTSIFKTTVKGQYIITYVIYRLNKQPTFNTSYGAIEQELEAMKVQQLSIKAISDAVIRIRQRKLPDPKNIGNAGSFFKNPIVSVNEWENLKSIYPEAPGYALPDQNVKLAAGWLIEKCGWKGKQVGHTGTHTNQALVLVNHGKATGKEVYALSEKIIDSVHDQFGVTLEREVNIL